MQGALPYQAIQQLQAQGFLKGFGEGSVQPASIDLSIGQEAYRIRGSALPLHGETVRNLLKTIVLFPHDLALPLEPGESYLCKIKEEIKLPGSVYGYTNPKSSTGRNDIQVRLLADGVPRFDTIPRAFNGELWLLVSSHHFLLKLTAGDKLAQLRLFDSDGRIGKEEMKEVYEKYKLLWDPEGNPINFAERKISDHDGSLILSVDLATEDIVGYTAKPQGRSPVLIFSDRGHKPDDFFDPIARPKDGMITLEKGRFYIFYTYEWSRVPTLFAAEMVAMDERSGEFRSHYAGYIDSGWGYGRNGEEKGWPLVLEVRPFDDNIIIRHKQLICKLRYENAQELPSKVYGETGSSYVRQKGALLSKHFRPVDTSSAII